MWIAALGGVSSAAPRARSSFEIDAGDPPSGLVARTINVERATITITAPSVERGASHARWSSGALAGAECAATMHARALAVLLERPQARVPGALRRTYDAHAPPRTIDRV